MTGITSYSQEPPPPLTQRQPTGVYAKNGTEHNIDTEDNEKPSQSRFPVIVHKKYTPTNEATQQAPDKKEATSKGEGKWDKTDIFSFFLMLFTAVLAFCNILLWRATRKSADTAADMAAAALGVELPWFIVTNMTLICEGRDTFIEVALANRGRTEAVIISECLVFQESPALDEKPRYPLHAFNKIDFGSIIESGQTYTTRKQVGISDTPISPILWGYGYIRYRDFLGKIHRFGFVGGAGSHPKLTNGQSFAFNEEGPPAYTYNIYDEKQHF